jgi:hypothetical protein
MRCADAAKRFAYFPENRSLTLHPPPKREEKFAAQSAKRAVKVQNNTVQNSQTVIDRVKPQTVKTLRLR